MSSVMIKASDFVYALRGDDINAPIITEIRSKDGYINATKLCTSAGKMWGGY